MATALYHPRDGYYSRLRGFGVDGDFITSPELHPAFGALLARQALDLWEALDKPKPLRIVEHGGGTGALARSLLDALAPFDVRYRLIETSPSLTAVQRAKLADYPVDWGVADEPAHLVLANEVVDALPVERVVMRDGVLRERRVDVQHDRLVFVETDRASDPIERYFAGLGVTLAEGACAEVNLGITPWVDQAVAPLERGLALVLDYGAPAEVLFARRPGLAADLLPAHPRQRSAGAPGRAGHLGTGRFFDPGHGAASSRAIGARVDRAAPTPQEPGPGTGARGAPPGCRPPGAGPADRPGLAWARSER